MIDFDLAMAVLEQHKKLTGHDAWALNQWNFCDTCMWLMNVCKRLKDQQNELERK